MKAKTSFEISTDLKYDMSLNILQDTLVGKLKAYADSYGNNDYKSRLNIYLSFMADKDPMSLLIPDLQGYADKLYLDGYQDSYVRNHISTLRVLYNKLTKDRDYFFGIVGGVCNPISDPVGFSEKDPVLQKAFVDEMVIRIENSIAVKIKAITVQDKADSEIGVRLETSELESFLSLPSKYKDTKPLRYLRDRAILSLIASTGIREGELVKLTVADLMQTYGGYPALRVKQGKGKKQRMIPYGDNNPLAIIEHWLKESGIDDLDQEACCYVFCAINKAGRPDDSGGSLTTRTVQRIFEEYSKEFSKISKHPKITPHDLRRSYAYLLWAAGVDLVIIKSNLGHSKIETTLGYIGPINAAKRLAPKIYNVEDVG